MRLKPVELNRRHWPKIEPIDVSRIDQVSLKLLIVSYRASDQCASDLLEHLFLWALDYAHERKHEFCIRKLTIWRITMNHDWPQISAALFFHKPCAKFSCDVFSS